MEDNIKEQLNELSKDNLTRIQELMSIAGDLAKENQVVYEDLKNYIDKYNSIQEIRKGVNKEILSEYETIRNLGTERSLSPFLPSYESCKMFGASDKDKKN